MLDCFNSRESVWIFQCNIFKVIGLSHSSMVREILLVKWLYHIFQSIMFGKYSKYKTISPNMWYWTIPHVSRNVWYCSIPHVWQNCHIFELNSPILLQLLPVLDLEFYATTFWQKKSYLPEPEATILIFCQTCSIDQYHMFAKHVELNNTTCLAKFLRFYRKKLNG